MTRHEGQILMMYEIEYQDPGPGCPVFAFRTRAVNAEHAMMRFGASDDLDGGGWRVLRIARVREDRPRREWNWITA